MKTQKELLPFELAAGFAAVAVIAFVLWANSLPPAPAQPQPSISQAPTVPTTIKVDSKVLISESPVVKIKPVITSPKNGSVNPSTGFRISGKATPFAELGAYINLDPSEKVGPNSYRNGGSGTADAQGNFSFTLAEPCAQVMTVIVAEVDDSDTQVQFYKADQISNSITFTMTETLPLICYQ